MNTALEDFRVTLPPVPMSAPRRMLTTRDLLSMSAAAARLAMKGKNYSPEDRADCAADTAARILTTYPAPRCYCGAPADYTAPIAGNYADAVYVPRCIAHRTDGARILPADAAHIPADAVTFTHCAHLAANYRRGLDRARDRDDRAAAECAPEDFTAQGPEKLIRPDMPTTDAAHEKARELLGALGLPRMGNAYPVAYTAARVVFSREGQRTAAGKDTGRAVLRVRDTDLATAAAELGFTGKTPDKALAMAIRRAARAIPSAAVFSVEAHCSALGMETDAAPARKASATRTASATAAHRKLRGLDAAAPDPAPVVLRVGGVRETTPPQWTRDLPPLTAARLKSAAEMKRARKLARTAAADPAETA